MARGGEIPVYGLNTGPTTLSHLLFGGEDAKKKMFIKEIGKA